MTSIHDKFIKFDELGLSIYFKFKCGPMWTRCKLSQYNYNNWILFEKKEDLTLI